MREYSIEDNKYLIVKENGKILQIDLDLLLSGGFIACEELKENKNE